MFACNVGVTARVVADEDCPESRRDSIFTEGIYPRAELVFDLGRYGLAVENCCRLGVSVPRTAAIYTYGSAPGCSRGFG